MGRKYTDCRNLPGSEVQSGLYEACYVLVLGMMRRDMERPIVRLQSNIDVFP